MAKSEHQQFLDIINERKNVLICLPQSPHTDGIASGLALFSILSKMGKKAKVVSSHFNLPPNHSFLPKSDEIESDLSTLRDFIISLNVKDTKVERIGYDIQDENLNIFIKPKSGFFQASDVRIASGNFAFDLIIVLDTIDLAHLGKIYEDNAEFFYNTPVVNIGHNPNAEHFGQINIIDINATSISEVLFSLLEELLKQYMDEYIATQLLTGIISKTKSFQAGSVTPKSLSVAGHLIRSGARRDEIVKHLYQTKSLSLLKLWGRTLARLKVDKQYKIVSSLLNHDDFEKSGSSENDLPGVVDELIVNTPDSDSVVITYEVSGALKALVVTPRYINSFELFKKWNPRGNKDFTTLTLDMKDLPGAENAIITILKEHLRKV